MSIVHIILSGFLSHDALWFGKLHMHIYVHEGICCIYLQSSSCVLKSNYEKMKSLERQFSCMHLNYKHMNDMFHFFVHISIIDIYISTYICELKNVCFRMTIKYFQTLRNRMHKVQHVLIAKYSSDEYNDQVVNVNNFNQRQ